MLAQRGRVEGTTGSGVSWSSEHRTYQATHMRPQDLELDQVAGSEGLVGDPDSGNSVDAIASDRAAVVDDHQQRVAVSASAD